jgi:Tfp pilus assembly protein PilF
MPLSGAIFALSNSRRSRIRGASPVNLEKSLRSFRLNPHVYVFAGVFLIRLAVLARLTTSAFLLPSRGDMHFYDEWARRILSGQLTNHQAFYGLPGYAYLLAALYRLCGYNPFVPAFLQALLDAATAVLIYKISIRVFGGVSTRVARIAGVVAAVGWAFFVPAQTYAVILMPTVLVVFVFWLIVWWVVRENSAPGKLCALTLGLLIGITATIVATILFLLPLVVGAVVFNPVVKANHQIRARIVSVLLLFAGAFAGTVPCWAHNYFIAHDPVILSAHSGINFWIGNNPSATGYPRFPPGLRASQAAMLQDSITAAESAAGRPLKRGEVSRFWSAKARDYIRHNPREWLRLIGVKLRNFWNAFQYDDLSIVTTLREQHVTFPGIYFGLVAALALPAIVTAWRIAPCSRWITAAIILHLLALLPVFTTERYRLPIVPGLLVFAAFGVVMLWHSFAARHFAPVIAYAALLVGSTFLVSWPQHDPSLWALDTYNSGLQALDSGDLTAAGQKLDLAYAYSPLNAEINFAEGNLHLAQSKRNAAKSYYFATLRLNPQHEGAYNNLGILALQEKRWDLAAKFFSKALEQDRRNAKTYYLLAEAHFNSGDLPNATAEIAQAMNLNPVQADFRDLFERIERTKQTQQGYSEN